MYENKTLICEDCKNGFILTAEEQIIQEASRTGRSAARHAAMQERTLKEPAERVLHHHLRKMRQGSSGPFPADQRQTGILQRLLRRNERRTVIRTVQTGVGFVA